MERRVDKNEETTSKEEEKVPRISARSQHNENSGITDANTCSSPNGNQGVVLRNDDSGRNERFLSSRSHFHDYARPPPCSPLLIASDADSSAVSNIEETLGIGMLCLESDPFVCGAGMSNSSNEDSLSTIESPAREPRLSSHLLQPASLQLLPEAQLNLSLDDNNPPNYADCSSSGESISSDPRSQLLPQTQDSNSLVAPHWWQSRRGPTRSMASAARYRTDPSSQLLSQTQERWSMMDSGDQTRLGHTSSIDSDGRFRSDPYSQLLRQLQERWSMVDSGDQTRLGNTSSIASGGRFRSDPYSQLLRQLQERRSMVDSGDQTRLGPTRSIASDGRFRSDPYSQLLRHLQERWSMVDSGDQSRFVPTSSTASAVRCSSDASSQLSPQTQDSSSLMVSDDQSRINRSRSSMASAATYSSNPSSPLLAQTQERRSVVISGDQSRRRPTSSRAVRCSSDASSQLSPHTQDSSSLMVSDDQSRISRSTSSTVSDVSRSTSSTVSDVSRPCVIPGCRFIYNTPHNFDFHIRWVEICQAYVCKWSDCGIASSNLDYMYQHFRSHSASFENSVTCTWESCNTKFTDVSEFLRHFKLHYGERPYVCGKCGATFERSEELHAHKVMHDSDWE